MINYKKHITFGLLAGSLLLLGGCTYSAYSTIGYERYYDPHPNWGRNDTTIIIDRPNNKPERPSKRPDKRPSKPSRRK
ncbi:MAG: hypothetical protein OCC45_11100 [Desulfotalea sp.]